MRTVKETRDKNGKISSSRFLPNKIFAFLQALKSDLEKEKN